MSDERTVEQGKRLAAARANAGYRSGRQAALANGWPESSYRAHECGSRGIGFDDADRYAAAFNVTAQSILFAAQTEEQHDFELTPQQREALAAANVRGLIITDARTGYLSSDGRYHTAEAVNVLVGHGLLSFFGSSRALAQITAHGVKVHKALTVPDDVEPQRLINSDGSVEFTCIECGMRVFCAVDDGFELPVCAECRFHGSVKLLPVEARR